MAIAWTPEGADDLLSALMYLRQRNATAAAAMVRQVNDVLKRLDELPLEGPEVQLVGGVVVRSWPVPPFRVYYQRRNEQLLVVRLYDQRREPIVER